LSRKKLSGIIIVLLVFNISLACKVSTLGVLQTASAKTIVRFEPQYLRVFVNETFTIKMRVENASSLYGFDIQTTWNTTCLKYLNHTATIPVEEYTSGLLHEPVLWIRDEVNETGVAGAQPETRYWIIVSSMAPAPPFNGSGSAVTMNFRALNHTGITTLNFTVIKMSDSVGQPISYTSFNGVVEIVAHPQIIIVPDDYPTIQEAINHANDGDTVYVKNGTYLENVVVNKTVVLTGEDRNSTIIDGDGKGQVIDVMANNVVIKEFTLTNSEEGDNGILVFGWSNVTIQNNNIVNNSLGVWIKESLNSTLSNNYMTSNQFNFLVSGSNLSHFIHDVDSSNLVDGKPVYYLINQQNDHIPSAAGYLALINCTNITAKNLHIKNNGPILLVHTNNSTITQSHIERNWCGITLKGSSNNTISLNNITKNTWDGVILNQSLHNMITDNNMTHNSGGIYTFKASDNEFFGNNIIANNYYGALFRDSSYNKVFHNNFINNPDDQACSINSLNIWDDGYPLGGNYWSNYIGIDSYHGIHQNETGCDGIGDTPYIINENNTDTYPLMKSYPWDQHNVGVTNLETSKTIVGQKFTVDIRIIIFNYGTYVETFNVTTYANTTAIASQNVTLTSLNSTTITFTWNATGSSKGNYTISTYTTPVAGETYVLDNNFTKGWVVVTISGDVDGDFDVDIYDVVKITRIYWSQVGDLEYKPNSDINEDGVIDIYDVVVCTGNYGQKDP
jgi:parallel beta-helix repeat protein